MISKVAIQGEKASFHDIAARQFFGTDIELVSCDTFKATFNSVLIGNADFAVCAIENSLFGSINETYDLLTKHHFVIIGEIYLRVEQCLIGFPGTLIENIKEIYSHPVALAQCEDYFDENLPSAKRLESHDTAASVAMIKKNNMKNAVAVASRKSADLYNMEVLAESIETNKQNYTRFIVLQPNKKTKLKSNKTSLIIKTSHKPGALYGALGVFAKRSINLTKLQSRPIIGKAWHYIFYVDVEVGINDLNLIQALGDLNEQHCEVKILGSYMAGSRLL